MTDDFLAMAEIAPLTVSSMMWLDPTGCGVMLYRAVQQLELSQALQKHSRESNNPRLSLSWLASLPISPPR